MRQSIEQQIQQIKFDDEDDGHKLIYLKLYPYLFTLDSLSDLFSVCRVACKGKIIGPK